MEPSITFSLFEFESEGVGSGFSFPVGFLVLPQLIQVNKLLLTRTTCGYRALSHVSGQRSNVLQDTVTPGALEADRLASELVSPQIILAIVNFSTLTASMSLLCIPSMLALHVSLESVISAEADVTQVTHIMRIVIHLVVIQVVVIHPEVHTTESHRELKAVGWWGSIYRVKNVWKTF